MDESEKQRIRDNLQRMADRNAPREKMVEYLKTEGLTPEAWRQTIGVPEPSPQRFQAAPKAEPKIAAATKIEPQRSLRGVLPEAIKNIPSSAWEVAKGTMEPFLKPVTIGGFPLDPMTGGMVNIGQSMYELAKALPYAEAPMQMVKETRPSGQTRYVPRPKTETEEEKKVREEKGAAAIAVGEHYADRFGSWQGFLKALEKDPVGLGLDVSAVASLPSAAGVRVPASISRAVKAPARAFTGQVKDTAEVDRLLGNYIQKSLRQAGEDPQKVISDTLRLGPNATVADVSPAMMRIMEELIGRPGPKGEKISPQQKLRDFFEARIDPSKITTAIGETIDPRGTRFGAGATKASAAEEAAKLAEQTQPVLEQAGTQARAMFEKSAKMRPQVIEREISQNLKPIQNVEAKLDESVRIRQDLNEQARQFLKDPISADQRKAFVKNVLERDENVRKGYEAFIGELRKSKDLEPFLPVDPTYAKGLVERFNKATEGMTETEKKMAEATFLKKADKERYGNMDGVRDEATGTINLTKDLLDRVGQWLNAATTKAYATDSDVVQSAMMKAQAEGSRIAQDNVSRILNEGKNNEYSQWKANLAKQHAGEEAMRVGRDVASGKMNYQQVELFLRDNPKSIDAVRDGFVDEYARGFRSDPASSIVRQANNEEMRRAIAALFDQQSSQKMTDALNRQSQLVQIEQGTSGVFMTPEQIAKKAQPVAAEFGGEKLYKQIGELEAGAKEAKGLADAVQSGRDIFSAEKLPSDLVETVKRFSPEERSAFQMGFLEKMMQEPGASLSKMASPEGDMFRKVEVALGREKAEEFSRLAQRQQIYEKTGKRFIGGLEAKAGAQPKSPQQQFADSIAALYQAGHGFIGSRADVAKRFLPGHSPMVYPQVRGRFGELMLAPPGETQPLTGMILGQPPVSGGFSGLSQNVLGPNIPSGAYTIAPNVEKAVESENSEAKQLERGERPL